MVFDRLYSIPVTHLSEGLVVSETDCGQTTSTGENKEVPLMVRFMNGIKKGIVKYSFLIVVLISLFHIGIAYVHSRESGRADQPF